MNITFRNFQSRLFTRDFGNMFYINCDIHVEKMKNKNKKVRSVSLTSPEAT